MARRSPTIRRPSFLIALAVVLVLAILYFVEPAFVTRAELNLYDQHFRLRGRRPANAQVVIVAVDEASLKAIGRWPWPRNVQATLIRRLTEAGAAVVAVDIIHSEPERSGALEAASRLSERLSPRDLGPAVQREIEALVKEADHDGALAAAVKANGRVVMATAFDLSPARPAAAPERQGPPLKSALVSFDNYGERGGVYAPKHADGIFTPIPPLLDAAKALGHVNMEADSDGTTRSELLIVEHRGHYYPSLALEAVRLKLGLTSQDVKVRFGSQVAVGQAAIPMDYQERYFIDYAGPGGTFVHHSAADLIEGRVPADRLRDRIVFIGATAVGTYDLRVTPFSPIFPGVEKHANVAANVLDGRFIARPPWIEGVELLATILVAAILAWTLPMFRPLPSVSVAIGLGLLYVIAAHVAFRQGLWLPAVYPALSMVLTFGGITILRFFTEERQRLFTKRAFQQFVSPEVVERIVANPGSFQFGGETRNLTILFCDIRDFTGFSERHDPQVVVAMLREHLTQLTKVVFEERGTLDKYIGDAIMAIFGAPVPLPDHAERACRAALKMVAESERLRIKWEAEGKEVLRIGVGINTGDAVVGNLGSEQVFDYTVTGDAVNLGARLESLNKDYKTSKPIIISEYTYEAARDVIDARPLGEVTVKGKTRPVAIYEVMGIKNGDALAPKGA